MEKNMKKNIYMQLNHFAVSQKLTQHYKSTIPQQQQQQQKTGVSVSISSLKQFNRPIAVQDLKDKIPFRNGI